MRYLEWTKSLRQKVEWWVLGAGRGRNGKFLFNGYILMFGKMKRVVGVDGGDGCTTV